MNDYEKWYWNQRFPQIKKALERNRFIPFLCEDETSAVDLLFQMLAPSDTIGLGGSYTLTQLGIYELLKTKNFNIINPPPQPAQLYENIIEHRRQSLLADAFISSTNAITEDGFLVNIDGISNRCAAILFGPKKVFILAGINKIVNNVEDGIKRIKNFVAPQNAKRLNSKTPCAATGVCMDCSIQERICSNTVISGFQNNPNRTHIILIKKKLGI